MSQGAIEVSLPDPLERDACLAADLVNAARRLLAEGRFLDLGALESRISDLCGRIAGMPKEEGRRFSEFLQEMNAELISLSQEIEARCNVLAIERTAGASTSAYRRLD
ncbi:MAG: hypothetical protein HQL43_04650 [Alphaproteobacteria bacterium]|nr:hypothetical protein [Alphaproteobacteria bacterium]